MSEFGHKAVGEISDLMRAASKGDIVLVQGLLANGIEANARDMFGNTALIFAAGGGHIDVVQLLLDRGADVEASNHINVTALKVAMSKGHVRIIQLSENIIAKRQQTEGAILAEDHLAEAHLDTLAPQPAAQDLSTSQSEKEAEAVSPYESERHQLGEKSEGPIPAATSSPVSYTTLETESHVPVQVSDAVERLISALEALRSNNPPPTATVSVADIAHKIMLTLPEATMLTGLSRNHLRQAIEKGMLKGKLVERGWRVKRTDLDDYVENL
jgi:excisionase family DNA binding protein